MFFYAVQPFSSADSNRLNIQSCVMYMASCVGLERGAGRCGLIYLMELFTGNRQDSNS